LEAGAAFYQNRIMFMIRYIYTFSGTSKRFTYGRGNLLKHHQCAASTWMMRRQPHHTPAYWWRGGSDEANWYIGMIRRP